jgi:hypothetical protein
MSDRSATPRAVPFYCPFCGEQDIRPAEGAGYQCAVCDRAWDVSLLGIGAGVDVEPADARRGATP